MLSGFDMPVIPGNIDLLFSDDYTDDEGPVDVIGITIGDISEVISVQGESQSQCITFVIPRYYDGIDLTNMAIGLEQKERSKRVANNILPR